MDQRSLYGVSTVIGLHGFDSVLPPDVGGFVGVESLTGDGDGYFAAEGRLGGAGGERRNRAEEDDRIELGIAGKGAAAKGGDVGRDEIVGDGGAVFKTAFGYFCQAMGYDKMAHIDAVFKGVGT